MMYDYSKDEVKIKLTKLEIDNLRYCTDLLERHEVKTILKRWEGKKFTKRIITELQKIDPGIYQYFYGGSIYIRRIDNRSVTDTPDENGNCHAYYIDADYFLFNLYEEDYTRGIKTVLKIDTNLRASQMRKDADELENQLNCISEITRKFIDVQEKINECREGSSRFIRDMFYLDFC